MHMEMKDSGKEKENARQFLKENSEIAEQIENQIRAASQKKDSSPDEHVDIDEEKMFRSPNNT